MPRTKRQKPTEDVIAEVSGESIAYQGSLYPKIVVIGQITKHRLLFCYEIQFLRTALFNIRRAKPDQMLHYLQIMDEKITLIAESFNKTLNELGDTDPRHTWNGKENEYTKTTPE